MLARRSLALLLLSATFTNHCYVFTLLFRTAISYMNNYLSHYISLHLQQIRLSRNLTEEQVANCLGHSVQEYKDLESGAAEITEEIFECLINNFDISIDDISDLQQISTIAQVNEMAEDFYQDD